ncbi:WD40 repeat-like protein [Basidiobolus meristosporus CBS 931.73]|uniref:WD40 repeat-like protein n=1 Tax=Basidiobolus meristosporus CBS 931.73 TaxID=1314790 RepID=A0A1Y1XX02_9FUNG|nr:WD40 repeat-like protein [Basidiobolus meristosporus CBS 931.73]|eukprot:ORX90253.1 WD40 repeat-like protein [Basidiobolus meristosporus CBS 931.73]
MATQHSKPWEANLLTQFQNRDATVQAFRSIFDSYYRLEQKLLSLKKEHAEEVSSLRVQQQQADLQKLDKGRLEERALLVDQNRFKELEKQILDLKEERGELYKTQGQNAQRLLEANETMKRLEQKSKSDEQKIEKLTAEVEKLVVKVQHQVEVIREKDSTIQFIHDEMTALQLELTKTDEKMAEIKKENSELLDRWIKKKNEEVERMNEANLYSERSSRHEKSLSGSSYLADAIWKLRRSTIGSPQISPTPLPKQLNEVYAESIMPSELKLKFPAHTDVINTIQISPDGAMIATGGEDKKVKIFDSRKGSLIHNFGGSIQSVMCVDFSYTDDMVLGTSNDNSTRLWSTSTGRLKMTLTGHIGKVFSARFNGDSSRVISGSHDRTIKIWDLHRGYCVRTIFSFSSCNDVCLADSDGSTIVSGHLDNNVRIWDARSGKCIKDLGGIHQAQITSVGVTPDGSKMLTSSRDNTLKLVDLKNYETLHTYQAEGYVSGMNWAKAAISRDGRYVAAGSADGTIYFWDMESSSLIKKLKEHTSAICGVVWSPLGDHVFSADRDRTVCIWN